MPASSFTIALAGNPNSGKTTLFNAFTGAKQQIGNWPGVTVDRKEGRFDYQDNHFTVVDLPGIYSFSANSLDEKISREYILLNTPDLVVNVVDANALERNLYLTTQLLEMNVPVVVALNMVDVANANGIRVDTQHLATHLGCPVVAVTASQKAGLDTLLQAILQAAKSGKKPGTRVSYDHVLETALEQLEPKLSQAAAKQGVDQRWLAVKFMEQDELAQTMAGDNLANLRNNLVKKVERHVGDEIDIVIADGRYGFIRGLARDVVTRTPINKVSVTEQIDKIVLNRVLGIPIFMLVMYLVFNLTIAAGGPFIEFFDRFLGTIFVDGFGRLLTGWGAPVWLKTLLADGLGGGIQTVSSFIPPIFFIFLFLSVLEDSGYMSRAAFVMDRFMRMIGLPGKAFIPMLLGFGCNVPAIMATRTLENNRDRILTILINPLMSCGARIPVYVLFAAVFFPQSGGKVIFAIYLAGIVLAVVSGLIFKSTVLAGPPTTFVMELPAYHVPTFNGIMLHVWQRLKGFVLRAGKVILLMVVVFNLLNAIGQDGHIGNTQPDQSLLARAGKFISPVFKPLGVQSDNWEASVALITGIFAKEAIVGTLSGLYDLQAENLEPEETTNLNRDWSFLNELGSSFMAFMPGGEEQESLVRPGLAKVMKQKFPDTAGVIAYLLFVLIYVPCLAVIGVIYKETSLAWAAFAVGYLTFLAWVTGTIFYQLATFARHPQQAIMWVLTAAGLYLLLVLALKKRGPVVKIG